jgi:hypothetical protein
VLFANRFGSKIRLQVQGELGGVKRGASHILRELGMFGLYKGASACLLRLVFPGFLLKNSIDFVPEIFLSPWYEVLDTACEDVRLT